MLHLTSQFCLLNETKYIQPKIEIVYTFSKIVNDTLQSVIMINKNKTESIIGELSIKNNKYIVILQNFHTFQVGYAKKKFGE